MTFSGYATRFATAHSNNFEKGRRGTKIDRFVVHHQAGYTDYTLQMMTSGSRQVSATYVIDGTGAGQAIGVVHEEDTPYTNGSGPWNRRSITFEIENQKIGSNIYGRPTDAAHRLTWQIIADAATRYGIEITRNTVVAHRELYTKFGVGYATACPGDLDVDWIVTQARALRGQAPTPAVPTAPAPVVEAVDYGPQAGVAAWKGLQGWLARDWGYRGDVDGFPGILTWTALQKYLAKYWSYRGIIDGKPGELTWAAVQRWLKKNFDYEGVVDGDPGPLTLGALSRAGLSKLPKAKPKKPAAGTPLPKTVIDGVPGVITWTRVQTFLEAKWGYRGRIDGKPGILTYMALQRFLARHYGYYGLIDGKPGILTWRALQRWLAKECGYRGLIDGKPGILTWQAFQRFANSV